MPAYILFNTDGTVARIGQSPTVPADATPISTPVALSTLATMMLVPRPASPEVTSDGTTHTVGDCPDGTVIEVHDVSGNERMLLYEVETEGEDVEIELADTGAYRIEIAAPLPALPRTVNITVD